MQKAKECHKMTRPRSKQLSSRKCWLPTAEATFRRRPHHRQRPGLPLSHPPWPQPALHHPAGPYLAETRPAKDPRDSTSTRPGPSAPPPRRRPHSLWRSASGLPPPPPQVPGHPGSGSRLPGAVGAPAGRGLPPPAPPPPQSREEPAADADGMHPRPIEARKRKGALDGLLRRPIGTLNRATASRPRPLCASARAEEASSNFPRVPPSSGTHGGAAAGAMGGAKSMGGTGRGGRGHRRGRTGPTRSSRARAACDTT